MTITGDRTALLRRLLVIPVGLALAAGPLASDKYMGIDEIRAGMRGTGRTVFAGAEPEAFGATILGVLRNAGGPQRHLILARLEGGPLAKTGVLAGMSGSPVYVDGRLVGAVAFAVGSFATEPIAGITPVGEMREATLEALRPRRRGLPVPLAPPFADAAVRSALRTLVGRVRPFAERADDIDVVTAVRPGASLERDVGTRLRPIATPLAFAGFDPSVRALADSLLGDAGFATVVGGTDPPGARRVDQAASPAGTLQAGDALGVELVAGDFSVGATGTVTEVDGDRVYAFGHPLFTLGPVSLPMTRAYVHALLPSLASSSKLATTGETIGTITEDRATAVAGLLGPGPSMIPVRIALDQGGGSRREFRFRVARDEAFTPLLIYVTVANVLTSFERQTGPLVLAVRGTLAIAGKQPVHLDEAFTGESPAAAATAAIAGPVTLLAANDVEPVDVESIDVEVSSAERTASWVLERAWLDDPRPRAGRTVALKVALRPYRGDPVVHTIPIDIPAHAPDRLTIQVIDGAQLARNDERDARWPQALRGADAIIAALNRAPRSNSLYIRLLAPSAGVVVGGAKLPALPPSALAVYDADRNGNSITALRSAIIGEWVVRTDGAVSGIRTLPLDLAAPR